MTLDDYDKLRKAIARTSKYTARTELPPDKLPSHAIVEALLEVVRKPLELAPNTPEGERRRHELARLRNIAMVEALLSSGMRVSELARLRRGHLLYDDQGAILKYTKGKKEREVLFSDRAWAAIMAYLAERRDGAGRGPLADLPVFSRHDRAASSKVLPLTTRTVQNLFADLAQEAGIADRFHLTPHTLRHFFATEFLSLTGNLALTQYALGHASPNTTRIYAQTRREDFKRAHREVFGGDKPATDKPRD
jgi:site-specific recombinase XerD